MRGKRFAWMPKVGNLSLDPDVAAATREAVEQLQQNGAEVEEIEVDLRVSADIIFAVTPPVFYAQFGSRLAEFAEKLDPTCRSVIERGADGLAHTNQAALMQRTALFRQVQRLFDTYDFLVMPTLSAPALPATHKAFDELTIGNVAAGTPGTPGIPTRIRSTSPDIRRCRFRSAGAGRTCRLGCRSSGRGTARIA